MSKPVTLSQRLVTSVIELIRFYVSKGVFRINEYHDISELHKKLEQLNECIANNKPYEDLSLEEYGFIILIFKEGSTRLATSIDSFGQIYGVYQAFQTLLEQKSAEQAEAPPTVEELEQ